LCLVRAIVIAKAHADKDPNAKNLKHKCPRKLAKLVDEIVQALQLPLNVDLNLTYVKRIEDYLQNYAVVVYGSGARTQTPLYYNKENAEKTFIYILHRDDHYDPILSITAFLDVKYFCEPCQVKYSHLGYHKNCKYICQSCYRANCKPTNLETCKCNFITNNLLCKTRHIESVCFKNKICNKCNTLKANRIHICLNEKYCSNCKQAVDKDHKCYILTTEQISQRDKKQTESKLKGYWFYDFESTADDETGVHTVCLAMAQRVCFKCIDASERCSRCTQVRKFYNISDFCDFLLCKRQEHFIFICHNSKGI
jgi:hypothetical protein